MKISLSVLLYIICLIITVVSLSCTKREEDKNDGVVFHLAKVRDLWRYTNLPSEENSSFERNIFLDIYVKNDSQIDAFLPINEDAPLSIDTIYQSKLVLSVDGYEIDCEIGVERKWTISSEPNVLYLREYQVNEGRHPHIVREKQIYSGDLNRKIYSGDSVAVCIHINESQLHDAGISTAMDIYEIIKKLKIRYDKNLEDLKYDDRPISDITFDLQKPIVEIDRRNKNE